MKLNDYKCAVCGHTMKDQVAFPLQCPACFKKFMKKVYHGKATNIKSGGTGAGKNWDRGVKK